MVPLGGGMRGEYTGIVYTAVFLAFALFARNHASLRKYWELSFAFFILGLIAVLQSFVNGYVGTSILHDPPNGGDPLASTVLGTTVIQLLHSLSAIVPIVVLTRLSGSDLGSIYVRTGVLGRWFVVA